MCRQRAYDWSALVLLGDASCGGLADKDIRSGVKVTGCGGH